jgi:hypothetical protein
VDSNKKLSYGPYCYQAATFIRYVKHFHLLPGAEDDEIMNEISDPSIQRYFTFLVITQIDGGWDNWRNSVKRIGTPPD